MRICGLSRAVEKDIHRCWDAVRMSCTNPTNTLTACHCPLQVKHAPLHRVHTFLATSDIHLDHKLNISREE